MVRAIICAMLLLTVGLVWSETMWPQDAIVRDAQELGYFGTPVKDNSGNVMNAWMKTADGKYTIYVDSYAPDGLSNWAQPLVVKISENMISDIKITATSDQAYILSWLEIAEGSAVQPYLQKVSSSGTVLWNPDGVIVNTNRVHGYLTPLLAANSEGGAYVFIQHNSLNNILGRYFNASGLEMWGANAPVIQTAARVNLNGLVSSGSDGAVLHYTCTAEGMNYLEKWQNTGFRQWQNIYPLDLGEQNQPHQIMITADLKTFDVVKLCNTDTRLKVRVWGSDGSQLLDQPFELQLSDNVLTPVDYKVCLNGQSLSVVYQQQIESISEVRYYALNEMVTGAFPAGGLMLGSHVGTVKDLQITYDDTGKHYCSWVEIIPGGDEEIVKANMVNNDLQAVWIYFGISLCSSSKGILSHAIQGSSASLLAFVNISETSSSSLVMRTVNQNGSYQSTTVDTVLNGTAYPIRTHALGDRTLAFYSDNRNDGLSRTYYQILGPNGERILPDAGVQFVGSAPTDYNISSCEMGSNQVAVLYQNMNFYLQIINYDGSLQFPNSGMQISNGSGFTTTKMSYYQNDLYLGWIQHGTGEDYYLMGQRISNGQKMWGENGKIIHIFETSSAKFLTASDGAYYTWAQYVPGNDIYSSYALLVDANGDPANGWSSDGLMIFEIPDETWLRPFYAQLEGADLLLVLGGYASMSNIYATKVTAGHVVPWGLSGIQLSGIDHIYVSCSKSLNGLSMLTGSLSRSIASVCYQHVDLNGYLQYAAPGLMIDQWNTSEGAPYLRLAGFANGGSVAVWTRQNSGEKKKLYYRTVSSLGVPVESSGQLLSTAQGNQDYLQISSSGNEALVTWRDGRSFHEYPDYSLYGVYAQKLNGAISSIPDQPEVCPANLLIKTCYPNPFTDSATMVWEQKANIPAEISVYNLKGQLVKRYSPDTKTSGEHSFIWNGKDAQDRKVSSGIYFMRIQCGKYAQTKKLVKM